MSALDAKAYGIIDAVLDGTHRNGEAAAQSERS